MPKKDPGTGLDNRSSTAQVGITPTEPEFVVETRVRQAAPLLQPNCRYETRPCSYFRSLPVLSIEERSGRAWTCTIRSMTEHD